MTEAERENERVKNLAATVYWHMDWALKFEDSARAIAARHGNNPVFLRYIEGMGLKDKLARFLGRDTLYAKFKRGH